MNHERSERGFLMAERLNRAAELIGEAVGTVEGVTAAAAITGSDPDISPKCPDPATDALKADARI
jgi:hypothetical protein